MDKPPLIYIDTCCFIDVLITQIGHGGDLTETQKASAEYTELCLKAARAGDIIVVTSTMTVAELRSAKPYPVTSEIRQKITSVLLSEQVVRLAQVTVAIAERARNLEWDHGITLKPVDSVHVATALEAECIEMLTLDGKGGPLAKAAQLLPLGLKVVAPSQTSVLPSKYLTKGLFDGT